MSDKKPINKYRSDVLKNFKERMKDYVPSPKKVFEKDFIIGYLLGELIWATKMPTLTHRPCGSAIRIGIPNEDVELEEQANEKWFINQTDENWKAYRNTADLIDEKYLPKEFEFYYADFFEKETLESDTFKSGIQSALSNTDGCPYSLDKDDIEITADNDGIGFIKIKFVYKKS